MYIVFVMAVLGYLLGSLNFSVLIGKLLYKTDVRNHGSKNAGATNTLRILGKKAAVIVLIGDMLKGIAAYYIAYYIGANFNLGLESGIAAGFLSVIGHNYPVFFNFKGGKGVLTSLAFSFAIDWRCALVALLIAIIIMAVTRYVSLGSIIGCVANAIAIIILLPGEYLKITTVILLAILAIVKHTPNIKRLIKGEESKIKFSKGA